MASHSAALKFDPDRLAVFGGSGGGGLAAGTALLARDRNGPRLLGHLLQCPMIDDRNTTASAHLFDGVGVWDTTSNRTAWQAVLGTDCGGAEVSPYSAPARAADLSGLPRSLSMSARARFFVMKPSIMQSESSHLVVNANCMSGAEPFMAFTISPLNPISLALVSLRETAGSSGC